MMRIGYAKDIHKLVAKRPLMLAGLRIPSNKGELAHSDGDVIIHALAEALLGALALGDLGKHFPDKDNQYKDMPGKLLLTQVKQMVKKEKYQINNIDISVELEKPKIAPYIDKMRKNLADILKINIKQISIKANTNEGFDATGEGRAVIATAVVLLEGK